MKKLGVSLAHFSALIIMLGLIKQSLYYYYFNVPIKYFLGLSEIGLLISDDLLIIVPIALVYIVFVNLAAPNLSSGTNSNSTATEEKGDREKKKVHPSTIALYSILVGAGILIIITTESFITILILLSFLLGYLMLSSLFLNETFNGILPTKEARVLGLSISIILVGIISRTSSDIRYTKKDVITVPL